MSESLDRRGIDACKLYSPTELSRVLDVDAAIIHRWLLKGIAGVKLPSEHLDGRRWIRGSDYLDWRRAVGVKHQ